MWTSNREVLRGRKEASVRMLRSAGHEPARGLASHALGMATVAVVAAVLLAFPYVYREEVPPRPEIIAADQTPASLTGTASVADLGPAIDRALSEGRMKAARAAWRDAYRGALRQREWEVMASLGDVALRSDSAGQRIGEAQARQAYLAALFRARAEGSLPGVLRATEAFATLGDRDVVDEGLRIAEFTARRSGEPDARQRVAALRARLEGQGGVPDTRGPSRPASWDPGP